MQVDSPEYPIAPGTNLQVQISGTKAIEAEAVIDNEIGYRVLPAKNLSLDFTGFYNSYSSLEASRVLPLAFNYSDDQLHIQVPISYVNGASAISRGAEFSTQWQVVPRWTLNGSYAFLHTSFATEPNSAAGVALPGFGSLLGAFQSGATALNSTSQAAPQQQLGAQSFWTITPKASFDSSVFYVGQVDAWRVPAYTRVDVHARYQLSRHMILGVSGQNLLSPDHLESGRLEQVVRTEVPRSVFGRITWSF